MASHNASAFLVNLFDPRFPLNLTTTQAPSLNGSNQLIQINLDGCFYDIPEKTSHVQRNQIYP